MVNSFTLTGRINSFEEAGIDEMTRQSLAPSESVMDMNTVTKDERRFVNSIQKFILNP